MHALVSPRTALGAVLLAAGIAAVIAHHNDRTAAGIPPAPFTAAAASPSLPPADPTPVAARSGRVPTPVPASGVSGQLWQRLNADTGATARGEWLVIKSLETAIRDRVSDLLNHLGS